MRPIPVSILMWTNAFFPNFSAAAESACAISMSVMVARMPYRTYSGAASYGDAPSTSTGSTIPPARSSSASSGVATMK